MSVLNNSWSYKPIYQV